jgi:hypothetical protein
MECKVRICVIGGSSSLLTAILRFVGGAIGNRPGIPQAGTVPLLDVVSRDGPPGCFGSCSELWCVGDRALVRELAHKRRIIRQPLRTATAVAEAAFHMTAAWILAGSALCCLLAVLLLFLAVLRMRAWRAERQVYPPPPDLLPAQVRWANEKRYSEDADATVIISADDLAYIRPVDWQELRAQGRPWPFRTGARSPHYTSRR